MESVDLLNLLDLHKENRDLFSGDDFTLYWENSSENQQFPQALRSSQTDCNASKNTSTSITAVEDNMRISMKARSCICTCFENKWVSGNFRVVDRKKGDLDSARKTPNIVKQEAPNVQSYWTAVEKLIKNNIGLQVFDAVQTINSMLKCAPVLLNSYEDGNELEPVKQLINDNSPLSGLVIFSGATKSRKTKFAQTFCLDHVQRSVIRYLRDSSKRVPHLVTFEDPIEGWKIAKTPNEASLVIENPLQNFSDFGFCLTPRQERVDVPNLKHSLIDALRQTPACFYIGEVRETSDWIDILEFAGTGHLVVATTHASSVAESLAKLISATDATTPQRRREIFSRLKACIHLKPGRGKSNNVYPEIWQNSPVGVNAMVNEGLGSLIPNGNYFVNRIGFIELYGEITRHLSPPQAKLREMKREATDLVYEQYS